MKKSLIAITVIGMIAPVLAATADNKTFVVQATNTGNGNMFSTTPKDGPILMALYARFLDQVANVTCSPISCAKSNSGVTSGDYVTTSTVPLHTTEVFSITASPPSWLPTPQLYEIEVEMGVNYSSWGVMAMPAYNLNSLPASPAVMSINSGSAPADGQGYGWLNYSSCIAGINASCI
ncbi:MAG: hypothetical protein A3F13_00820 [Gammaproteobacteria bacterium RIFCSPHIGHO2_12_FULL_40_19]|nr:MAG: hypothetical protein A3F13_00820 [Gammaproteobacteria bacterium RIFCSPHIGHO2_12_FULL_40_19]